VGTVKSAVYKLDNGTDFDEIYFRTIAAQVKMASGVDLESGFINSKTESGYTKLPNGMILQWGVTLGSHDVYFPIEFPSTCIWAASIGKSCFTDSNIGPYVTKSSVWTWSKSALAIMTYGYEKLSSFTATQAGYVSTLSCADFGGKSLWFALGY